MIPDYSQLDAALIKEGDLLMMGVLNGGPKAPPNYIPLQAVARFETKYEYDPIAEGQIPAGGLAPSASTNGITNTTFQPPLQLGSQNVVAKPYDIFDLTYYPQFLYQMFLGIDPEWLRVFFQQPFTNNQRSLPIVYWTPNYPQEGFWDGYESPPWRISPKTQMLVLPGLSIALGYENKEPRAAFPMLTFYINALNVAPVYDPDVAWAMLTAPGKARFFTVGGLNNINWNPTAYYGISGFPLTASKAEVDAGVTPTRNVQSGQRPV